MQKILLLLVIISYMHGMHEPAIDCYKIVCADKKITELSPQQMKMLRGCSSIKDIPTFKYAGQATLVIPDLKAAALTDFITYLQYYDAYKSPEFDLNRIHKMLAGTVCLDIDNQTITPWIIQLKNVLMHSDLTNKQSKKIIHSEYLEKYRALFNSPVPAMPYKTLKSKSKMALSLALCKKTLLAITVGKKITIFDLNSGKQTHSLKGHKSSVYRLVTDGENKLVSSSQDKTIKLWDLNSGKCLQTLTGHTNPIIKLTMCDANTLASCSNGTINIWDLNSGQCSHTLTGNQHSITSLMLCNKNLLASGSLNHIINIWNLKTGNCSKTLVGHGSAINSLVMCGPDLLASSSCDKTIKLWNLDTGKCIRTLTNLENPTLLVMCDQYHLAGVIDNRIKIWNVRPSPCLFDVNVGRYSISTMVLCKPHYLAVGTIAGTLHILDLNSGKWLRTWQAHSQRIRKLITHQDNELISCSIGGEIKLWNLPALCNPEYYTPAQNILMQLLPAWNQKTKERMLADNEWQEAYNSLPTSMRNELKQ